MKIYSKKSKKSTPINNSLSPDAYSISFYLDKNDQIDFEVRWPKELENSVIIDKLAKFVVAVAYCGMMEDMPELLINTSDACQNDRAKNILYATSKKLQSLLNIDIDTAPLISPSNVFQDRSNETN
jgi:hypothetical protein